MPTPTAKAQKLLALLGVGASSFCFILGFPCASGPPAWAFRLTCAGFFSFTLGGFLSTENERRTLLYRIAMFWNSLASGIVSGWWCFGFRKWCILMVLEHIFQVVGMALFVGHSVPQRLLLTAALSGVGYCGGTSSYAQAFKAEVSETESSTWAISVCVMVATLVSSMSTTGFYGFLAFRRKVEALWKILTMPVADFEEFKENVPVKAIISEPNSRDRTPVRQEDMAALSELRDPLSGSLGHSSGHSLSSSREPQRQWSGEPSPLGSLSETSPVHHSSRGPLSDLSLRGGRDSRGPATATPREGTLEPGTPAGDRDRQSGFVGETHRSGSSGSGGEKSLLQSLRPTRPPFEDVTLKRLVGQGSFGKVYHALWMGSPVAVKVIRSANTKTAGGGSPLFEAELSATLSHPCLVQTYKYSTRPSSEDDRVFDALDSQSSLCTDIWIVQEWCDRGTLREHAQKPRTDPAGLAEVADMFSDICSAGSYLHSRGIIHGDLTANNVLLRSSLCSKGYVCKVCDFGLARVLEAEMTGILTAQLGTVSYMPPELFTLDTRTAKMTPKVDIYSLAVLLWQTITGLTPYEGLMLPQIVISVLKGNKLKLPDEVPETFHQTFTRCIGAEATARPTFDELVEFFTSASRAPGAS